MTCYPALSPCLPALPSVDTLTMVSTRPPPTVLLGCSLGITGGTPMYSGVNSTVVVGERGGG